MLFVFISEMQPNFGEANVSANRRQYKTKNEFFGYIVEMQPNFGEANGTNK